MSRLGKDIEKEEEEEKKSESESANFRNDFSINKVEFAVASEGIRI